MSTGPKDKQPKSHENTGKRGGYRPGAGRPHKYADNTEAFRDDLLRALADKAEETGRTVADELADVAYGKDKREKMPALRLIFDKLIVSTQHRVIEDRRPSGEDGLPEERPDPATVVPIQ